MPGKERMLMEWMRSFSMLWSLTFVLILFLVMYDLRFSHKKNITITCATMLPLVALTAVLQLYLGSDIMGKLIYVILTVPSLIFFILMSKKPDGRFFFTFCLTDTIGFELITLTLLLDEWLGDGNAVLLFWSRLILFPLVTFFIWKYVSKAYKQVQENVKTGWWLFALVSVLYYGLLMYMVSFPELITLRPEDLPSLLVVFLLMPLNYVAIFGVLLEQRKLHEMEEQSRNADRQATILQNELTMEQEYVEQARQSRHDLRHNIHVIRDYLNKGDVEGAKAYLAEYEVAEDRAALETYCSNEIVGAVLRLNARKCEQGNISFLVDTQIPETLPYTKIETGTLFGNLLENAWEAASQCTRPFISVTAMCKEGMLLVEIRNSVSGTVEFREEFPVSTKVGGGIGLRGVREILRKHDGMIRMEQQENVFVTQLIQPLVPPVHAEH